MLFKVEPGLDRVACGNKGSDRKIGILDRREMEVMAQLLLLSFWKFLLYFNSNKSFYRGLKKDTSLHPTGASSSRFLKRLSNSLWQHLQNLCLTPCTQTNLKSPLATLFLRFSGSTGSDQSLVCIARSLPLASCHWQKNIEYLLELFSLGN
jgi:hypothetical protein